MSIVKQILTTIGIDDEVADKLVSDARKGGAALWSAVDRLRYMFDCSQYASKARQAYEYYLTIAPKGPETDPLVCMFLTQYQNYQHQECEKHDMWEMADMTDHPDSYSPGDRMYLERHLEERHGYVVSPRLYC